MKRQKRNKSDRAYTKGYQTGVFGRSKDMCPHENPSTRKSWLTGWREGRCDNCDGMTGISGVQQMFKHINL